MARLPFLGTNIAARALRAVFILGLTGIFAGAWALENPPPNTLAPAKPTQPMSRSSKAPIKPAQPQWSELTPAQQVALAPLAGDWSSIDAFRKKKWLVIANKFPTMKPEEQNRVQDRMREWVKLTPEQRRTIRESYARTKKLNAEQKSEKWQQYQNLPEEQKKKLAAEAESKKRLPNLPRVTANKNRSTTPIKLAPKPASEKPVAQQNAPLAPPASAAPSSTK